MTPRPSQAKTEHAWRVQDHRTKYRPLSPRRVEVPLGRRVALPETQSSLLRDQRHQPHPATPLRNYGCRVSRRSQSAGLAGLQKMPVRRSRNHRHPIQTRDRRCMETADLRDGPIGPTPKQQPGRLPTAAIAQRLPAVRRTHSLGARLNVATERLYTSGRTQTEQHQHRMLRECLLICPTVGFSCTAHYDLAADGCLVQGLANLRAKLLLGGRINLARCGD